MGGNTCVGKPVVCRAGHYGHDPAGGCVEGAAIQVVPKYEEGQGCCALINVCCGAEGIGSRGLVLAVAVAAFS